MILCKVKTQFNINGVGYDRTRIVRLDYKWLEKKVEAGAKKKSGGKV